jgi:hypothetical protein
VADEGDPPEIQSLMAPDDFTASGLDKLTDAERAQETTQPVTEEDTESLAQDSPSDSGQETTQESPGGYTTQAEKQKIKEKNTNS